MKNYNGNNLETVQNMNRALVIKLLYGGKYNTRISIAQASGLNRATISNIVDDLMDWGLVSETGNISGKKGRRSIALELNARKYVTICVHILRDALVFGVLDIRGNYKKELRRISTVGFAPQKTVDLIKREVSKMITSINAGGIEKLIGIGFAVPGPYIRESGNFVLMSHVPGWEHINFASQLQWGDDLPVFLEHDANCAAFAEWWYKDSASKHSSILFLCAGPGIGAGIIENGKLLSGCLGIAGEVGHMSINYTGPLCECGHRGCLELYASTFALENEALALFKKGFPSSLSLEDMHADSILEAVNAGDPLAVKAFDRIAEALGFGVVNLVNLYNPEVIYLGDTLSKAPDRLLKIVSGIVKENLRNIIHDKLQIKISHFNPEETVMLGISAMVFDNIVSSNSLVKMFKSPTALSSP
ncbi:ROK family protein [Treponema sp. OttesenSCG-928-L16]|nr:ROK family protein [Treponema sp. OttesenSCG-928-L16]